MTRLISCLFAIAALSAALSPAAQEMPMAKCKDGKCEVSEADWKKLQEFHKFVRQRMKEMDEAWERHAQSDQSLLGGLMACRQRLEDQKA